MIIYISSVHPGIGTFNCNIEISTTMIHITYNTLLVKMYTKPNYLYFQQKGRDSKKNRDILVIVYARKIILNFQTCIQSILIYVRSVPQYDRKALNTHSGIFFTQNTSIIMAFEN